MGKLIYLDKVAEEKIKAHERNLLTYKTTHTLT